MRYFLTCALLSFSCFISAQLDNCGNDFRPINTLNKYEVDYLNSFVDNKPIDFNDSLKIAFFTGLGGGALIQIKLDFFKAVKSWDKTELQPALILLTNEERISSKGYDALVVYHMSKFNNSDRMNALESIKNNDLYSTGLIDSNPFDYSYVETLSFIYDSYDTSAVMVQQDRTRIVIKPKNDSCFSIKFEIDEVWEYADKETCNVISYETTCSRCNDAILNSAFDLSYWIPLDENTYISQYGIGVSNPRGEKKRKMALTFKMVVEEDETVKISIVKDEMDFREFKRLKKKHRIANKELN